ncbi:tyrosine-type recombinase/integrase [Burkholderia vietnamiensis]|uniref:tyrosine-type recombinase/integrase n=1 Tax=Burkholderia vietnamiensis TaxID=60552 RepID=UPI00264D2D08|nr:tyrosine-type recombinase/integrase [Burkholderia vietnamiensis]MDN8077472.1 tyrosine-type recombinase/integrase [Burkholderia vietnamiensis]
MPTPRLASRLHRSRYGVFHFRFILPPAFAAACNRREIWHSLRTRDPDKAKLLAYVLNAKVSALLMSKPDPELVRKLLNAPASEIKKNALDFTLHGVKLGGVEIERIELDNSTPEALERDHAALNAFIATHSSPPITVIDPEEASRQAAEAAKLRPTYLASKSPELAECIRQYLTAHVGLSPASRKDYTNCLNRFAAWASEVMPIQMLDRNDLRQYFEYLSWLPTNYEKRKAKDFGGMEGKEFVKRAMDSGIRPKDAISATTQKVQQVTLNGFFQWLIDTGIYKGDNPARALVKLTKQQREKEAAGSGYEQFTPEELGRIFDPANFLPFATRPEDYYCIQLGLYTGARLEELCQLRVDDVFQEGGFTFIRIRPDHTGDDETETRVKNTNSVRNIPLAKAALETSFLEWVEIRKSAGKTRLFDLNRDHVGKHSKNISRRFGEYLTSIGIKTSRRKSFHSFRSNTIDKMVTERVSEKASEQFAGHAPSNIQRQRYSREPLANVALAEQTLGALVFPTVDTLKLRNPSILALAAKEV